MTLPLPRYLRVAGSPLARPVAVHPLTLRLMGAAVAVIAMLLTPAPAWAADAARSAPAAQLAAGEKHFRFRCAACHAVSAAAPALFGPHLEGIVNRTGGSVAGYAYSDPELRGQTFVWDLTYFEEWLQRPQEKYPQMCVPFRGLPSAEARAALFRYLQSL